MERGSSTVRRVQEARAEELVKTAGGGRKTRWAQRARGPQRSESGAQGTHRGGGGQHG